MYLALKIRIHIPCGNGRLAAPRRRQMCGSVASTPVSVAEGSRYTIDSYKIIISVTALRVVQMKGI